MTSIILLCIIIAGALILFISERVRVDIVALLIMGALILTGILSPMDAVKGFSNQATVTVLFMYILSASLLKTGALSHVGAVFC
jgi:di/tricarboxylate transporter